VIAGIVLAAGLSSRLGRNKHLLPLAGEPLLRHTLRRVLAAGLDRVLLVVGHDADEVRRAASGLPVEIVFNPDFAQGQSSSVLAGLAALGALPGPSTGEPAGRLDAAGGAGTACRAPTASSRQNLPIPAPHEDVDAAMFLLGDQPGVDPAVIDALVAAWRETGAAVVAPRYLNGLGNPVLFDRGVFPEFAALAGDAGARAIVRAHRRAGDLHVVPISTPAPRDVDTEADYAALLAALDSSHD
jgi:molybdenum cofactor cytidylyltransferase